MYFFKTRRLYFCFSLLLILSFFICNSCIFISCTIIYNCFEKLWQRESEWECKWGWEWERECVWFREREMMDHIRSLKILMIELSAIDPNLVLHFSVSNFIIFFYINLGRKIKLDFTHNWSIDYILRLSCIEKL